VNSVVTADFRDRLDRLPGSVRQSASRAHALWKADPHQPGLQYKRVSSRHPIFSARVGLGHRALAYQEDDKATWFWIGTHAEYDQLLARL
jgi:hypothetical protein